MKIRFLIAPILIAILATASYAQDPEPIPRDISDKVVVDKNLMYASYDDRNLLLDLYRPAQRGNARLPVVVVIRGGGWARGDKDGFGPMAAALAERGFAAASIEFRTSGEAVFPAAVEDTKAAVRWVRANAEKFNLESDAIGAIGGSSGAHMALYLGVTHDMAELEGDGGNPAYSSSVSAVVGLATPGDFTKRPSRGSQLAFLGSTYEEAPDVWAMASPVTHISASSPPLLLIQSESDGVVPFEQSIQLANAYGRAGVPVELVLIPDAPHAFWNFNQWFEDTMDRAATFLGDYLNTGQ